MKFEPMPKMPRLNKQVIVTEKIDGTNAQIAIEVITAEQISQSLGADGNPVMTLTDDILVVKIQENGDHWLLRAGSKNRWLTRHADNFGFANWAFENAQDLLNLGPGVHRGEWWGRGIQCGYGLTYRRFSLFNVSRWHDTHEPNWPRMTTLDGMSKDAPACCHVVPAIGLGDGFQDIEGALATLKENGSLAAPGYMKPEGIVCFHTGSNLAFKATIENDLGKWMQNTQPVDA